jgi:ABC-type iron transport system FetAB ATPase subunit
MRPDEDEVLDVFRQFLTGMEQRNPDTLKDLVLPNGTMTRVSGGELQQISIAALLDMFPREGSSTLEERLYGPVVHTDGDIAVIWCTYDFRVDGDIRHAGSNIVSLARTEGRWVISGLSDTARFTHSP